MRAWAKKWQIGNLFFCVAMAYLGAFLSGCEFGSILKPEPPQCSTLDPSTMATDWNGYHLRSGDRHPKLVDKTGGLYDVQAMADSWAALRAPVDFAGTSDLVVEVVIGEPAGALGVAEVKILDGHIVYGRITMNPKAIARAGLTAPEVGAHVLCQEGGHSPFGLGHERFMQDTCMNDCVGVGSREDWVACLSRPDATTPNAADGRLLQAKYAHDDDKGERPPDIKCVGWMEVHRMPTWEARHEAHH